MGSNDEVTCFVVIIIIPRRDVFWIEYRTLLLGLGGTRELDTALVVR